MSRTTAAFGLSFLLVALLALSAPGAWAGTVFDEQFDGTSVDPGRWDTAIATSGRRFCGVSPANGAEGAWQDSAFTPCHGMTAGGPYGSLSVLAGDAIFEAGSTAAFPFIHAGPPLRSSPFPATGDFTVQLRAKYDRVSGSGTGLKIGLVPDGRPQGTNAFEGAGTVELLALWGDTGGVRASLLGQEVRFADPLGWHTFVLEHHAGSYALAVDGVQVAERESSVRPNHVWIGQPLFAYWGTGDWSDFRIDRLRVTSPDAAPPAPPIVAAPPPPPAPAPAPDVVAPTPLRSLGASFTLAGSTGPRGLRVRKLTVRSPVGSTVEVSCEVRRCRKRVIAATRRGTVRVPGLAGRRLRRGTILVVRVTKPGHVGRVARFSILRRDVRKIETDLPAG